MTKDMFGISYFTFNINIFCRFSGLLLSLYINTGLRFTSPCAYTFWGFVPLYFNIKKVNSFENKRTIFVANNNKSQRGDRKKHKFKFQFIGPEA